MDNKENLPARKSDHIRINLSEDVSSGIGTGLDAYFFEHQALPEIDFDQVNTAACFLGKKLGAPLLVSSMTGGTDEAMHFNHMLAQTAQMFGFALGVGSQRAAIENRELSKTFRVRKFAPSILLFANLGAIQLNRGYSVTECRQAVEMIEADGLILHLNPLQEALQPEGETNFGGLLKKIEQVCRQLEVPVIAKEVGWGISESSARQLINAGIAAIDVAGAGGTSWSQVEMHRISDPFQAETASSFRTWGISTAESLKAVRRVSKDLPLIASGGLRDGVDAAKCLALGANLCGMAGRFLKAAAVSEEHLNKTSAMLVQQLKVAMFAAGAVDIDALSKIRLNQ